MKLLIKRCTTVSHSPQNKRRKKGVFFLPINSLLILLILLELCAGAEAVGRRGEGDGEEEKQGA